jgi:hypothetical protein
VLPFLQLVLEKYFNLSEVPEVASERSASFCTGDSAGLGSISSIPEGVPLLLFSAGVAAEEEAFSSLSAP